VEKNRTPNNLKIFGSYQVNHYVTHVVQGE